jgi:hypothetical protein
VPGCACGCEAMIAIDSKAVSLRAMDDKEGVQGKAQDDDMSVSELAWMVVRGEDPRRGHGNCRCSAVWKRNGNWALSEPRFCQVCRIALVWTAYEPRLEKRTQRLDG